MKREELIKLKNGNVILRTGFIMATSFYSFFLNYIVSVIPVWCVRRFFYKISGMKIGQGARIGLHTKVIRPGRISIGERTVINESCYLDGRGGLKIGSDCSVSIYTKMITASHKVNSIDFSYFENGIEIKDHSWIGCAAIILDGSIISNGCIIGAGTVMKEKTEQFGIYVGNPAKKIKSRNPNINYKLDFHPFFR